MADHLSYTWFTIEIIKTANTILSQLTVPRRVKTIEDVNVDMFITLYEGLCGESLPDLITPANSEEAEVHNMQCVIDSLALDILHTSLAHIVGQDVVRGRRMSIINLLDIFSGLLEYILDGIERDDSSAEIEASKDLDAINQSILSDAVRRGLTDTSNIHPATLTQSLTSDDNTEDLIALGKSPTASPSSKKSRRSGEHSERRRSKKATLQAVSQPIASSSMQSLIPSSCTGSESDTSTKPSAGRALAFSKVPADFSPQGQQTRRVKDTGFDSTFTKPSVPPERNVASKLADEILKTGESTTELIALGETPVLRTRTRSSTKKMAAQKNSAVVESDGSEETMSQRGDLNTSNNARNARSSKRHRQPRRHVSFVSDRTMNTDDTLADITTRLEEPKRVASEPYPSTRLHHNTSGDDRLNLSSRLVDYFDQKEAYGGHGEGYNASSHKTDKLLLLNQADGRERSATTLTDTTEYQTAIEKSASLYDRVTALRNAASEKLESLRRPADSVSDSLHTAPATAAGLSTTEYQEAAASHKISDYARRRAQSPRAGSEGTEEYHSAGSQSEILYKTAREASESSTARQSNAPDLHQDSERATRACHTTSADSYNTARPTHAESEVYKTTRRQHPQPEDRLDSVGEYRTAPAADNKGYMKPKGGEVPYQSALLGAGYGFDHHPALTCTKKGRPEANNDKTEKLRSMLDDDVAEPRSLSGHKRPDWKTGVREQPDRKVRFNRSNTSAASGGSSQRKTKSETMVDAVKKTLDEEKWRDRIQQKLLARQYKDDLTDMVDAHREQLEEEKSIARLQDKEFASNVHRLSEAYGDKPRKTAHVYNPKGFLLPKSRVLKKKPIKRCRVDNSAGLDKPAKSLDPGEDDFLPNLMEEFPHLYLAPETIKQMWTKHQQQSAAVNKSAEEDKRKRCKAKTTIEDAEKRQALLMNIMQKELDYTKRLKQMRDKENADIENRRKARDVRVQSARVKKYYDDYSTRMKSSMLKNKTKEEQLFKKLFAEGLRVQKERMQALRSYTREQRDKRAQKQQVDVASLENFYKDQFSMLAENVSQERRNVEVRDTAQAKVLDKMKMELRRKMERDIKDFQEQLKRDEDDYYFRQLDAERVVQQLNMTRYQTGI